MNLKSRYLNRCYIVSFLTAFITLSIQILLVRIISAKLLNNFAFLIISMTMLGFALSGVILALNQGLIKHYRKNIHFATYLFVLTQIISTIIFYRMPIVVSLMPDGMDYLLNFSILILTAGLFVVPFLFCGLILGMLLSSPRLPTRKIYGFDLAGSALGAALIVFFISGLGVERSMLILLGLYVAAINIFFPIRLKVSRWASAGIVLLIGVLLLTSSQVFKLRFPWRSHLTGSAFQMEYFRWDPISRIEVSKFDVEKDGLWESSMKGNNKEFRQLIKKALTQNNNAGTFAVQYDGNPESLKGIEGTMYNLAYQMTSNPSPKVCVIGVGGGTDILSALYSNASSVTGVEINGATLKVLKDLDKEYFKNWVNDPKVKLVHDEGRQYLEKSDETYDILQLTGVDSYVGTLAAANIFSESYLYTKEAVGLYYDRIRDDGIVCIIRLEYPGLPREMVRMLTTVLEVLRSKGIKDPAKHIVMVTSEEETLTALMFKKVPITPTDIGKINDWIARYPYFYMSSASDVPAHRNTIYRSLLSLNEAAKERNYIKAYPLNIRPAEDDMPFFFRYTKWKHIDPNTRKDYYFFPYFEYDTLLLLGMLTAISGLFIYLPLRKLCKQSPKEIKRFTLVFASIGLGYMFIEIAYMQKLGLFLGHPNLAIAVVLAGLLLSTGIGSMYYKNITKLFIHPRYANYCLALIILLEYILILPKINSWIAWNGLIKGAIALALLFPIGLILGTYMPHALDQLKKISPQHVPWGWGINGIFSVMSPILALAISATFGINFLLLCSIPVYLVAGSSLHQDN